MRALRSFAKARSMASTFRINISESTIPTSRTMPAANDAIFIPERILPEDVSSATNLDTATDMPADRTSTKREYGHDELVKTQSFRSDAVGYEDPIKKPISLTRKPVTDNTAALYFSERRAMNRLLHDYLSL